LDLVSQMHVAKNMTEVLALPRLGVSVRCQARSKVPLLVIAAHGDMLTPPGPLLAMEPKPPHVEVVEILGNHFRPYEAGFEASSGAAIAFFQRHLGG
jgi:hypothetical protein